jgi:hypothetical protein
VNKWNKKEFALQETERQTDCMPLDYKGTLRRLKDLIADK